MRKCDTYESKGKGKTRTRRPCDVCGSGDSASQMVTCSSCNDYTAHVHCLTETLSQVATKKWSCAGCKGKKHDRKETSAKEEEGIFAPIEEGQVVSLQGDGRKFTLDVKIDANGASRCSRIGTEYQCEVPPVHSCVRRRKRPRNDGPEGKSPSKKEWQDASKMRWCPYRMAEDDVERYLKSLGKRVKIDFALQCLHQADYDPIQATRTYQQRCADSSADKESWQLWSSDDEAAFNAAMHTVNNKYLGHVARLLEGKSLSDVLQYYYVRWKFTPHRELWYELDRIVSRRPVFAVPQMPSFAR